MPEEVLKRLEEKTKLTKEEEEMLEAARKETNRQNKVSHDLMKRKVIVSSNKIPLEGP